MRLVLKVLDRELYESELVTEGFGPKRRGDAGLDLKATADLFIAAGQQEAVGLGVAVEIPPGHVGLVLGRSSTLQRCNAPVGVIDSGYRGEIHAFFESYDKAVVIKRGDRVVQLIVVPVVDPKWEVADELSPSERGEDRFGSTDAAPTDL